MRSVCAVLVCAVLCAGCATDGEVFTPKTKQGAAIGAAVGGVLGAIIHDDNRWVGAAVGAAAGAVVGGAVGNIVDRSAAEAARSGRPAVYTRTTADGTQERIVATPGLVEGGHQTVVVEYYRNGVKVAEETRKVPVQQNP